MNSRAANVLWEIIRLSAVQHRTKTIRARKRETSALKQQLENKTNTTSCWGSNLHCNNIIVNVTNHRIPCARVNLILVPVWKLSASNIQFLLHIIQGISYQNKVSYALLSKRYLKITGNSTKDFLKLDSSTIIRFTCQECFIWIKQVSLLNWKLLYHTKPLLLILFFLG